MNQTSQSVEQPQTANLKTITIKDKQYVEVKERILFLSKSGNPYSVKTKYKYYPDRLLWVVSAILEYNGNVYTGHAQEIEPPLEQILIWENALALAQNEVDKKYYKAKLNQVNTTSALENAETSAIGRACAMAGIGVLDSIASVDEINKAKARFVYKPRPVLTEGVWASINFKDIEGKEKLKQAGANWNSELKRWELPNTPDNQALIKSITKSYGLIEQN